MHFLFHVTFFCTAALLVRLLRFMCCYVIHHHNNTFKDISQWKPWKNVYKVRKLQLQTRRLLLMNLADVPSKFQRMSASEIAQEPKNRMKIEG
jgi:hypothetical protein